MRTMISSPAAPVHQICDLNELSVSNTDLESLRGHVVLSSIDLLQFDETVDRSPLDKHVKEKCDVDILNLPSKVSKYQILTKSRDVDLIRSRK